MKKAAITAVVLRLWRIIFSYLNQPKTTLVGQCDKAHRSILGV